MVRDYRRLEFVPSKRYTVVIADRASGVVRRFTIRLRPALAVASAVLALPILMGLGARWSATSEIEDLQMARAALELENASYRAATGELITQISSLQAAIADLGERAQLDPATIKAIEKLPAVLKSRAVGGAPNLKSTNSLLSTALTSPESTFGVLRDLLGSLESRLQLVRHGVERRAALAAATPSIWPAYGWLSSTFGVRHDPFTGERAFHPALDISTEKGQPVYATAAGTVESASYSGAYGNLVVIRHGFGISTRYGHLSQFAVRPGATVGRGQVIGYVGSTGRATDSHVHYEVWLNGQAINPLRLLVRTPQGAN